MFVPSIESHPMQSPFTAMSAGTLCSVVDCSVGSALVSVSVSVTDSAGASVIGSLAISATEAKSFFSFCRSFNSE